MFKNNRWLHVVLLLLAAFASIALTQNDENSLAWSSEHRTSVENKKELLLAMNDKQSELIRRINDARRARHLSPLKFSGTLSSAAQSHVTDLVEHNFELTHTGSDGSSVRVRARRENYPSSYVGENVAAGNYSVEDTFEQWMNSPGHRDNILDPDYTEIGIGYYLNAPNTSYDHYWVTVFGNPDR
jgi:uncharacterized protein YkwD